MGKTSRDSLAQQRKQIVVDKLQEMKEEYGLIRILKRIAYFILVVAGQWLLFLFTNWIFRKLRIRIDRLKDTRLKPVMLQNYELLDTGKQVRLLQIGANLLRYLFMLVQLLFSVPHCYDLSLFARIEFRCIPRDFRFCRSDCIFSQGISVFVGLIVSLGSTTVIGNIIAGLVITYMRPFKIGDQIKLNDTTGNVIEKHL